MAKQMAAAFNLVGEAREKMLADASVVKPSPGNPPATLARIEHVQRELGVTFPDDYRELLLIHDGWPRFSGDYGFMSTEEMLSPEWRASIAEVVDAYASDGDDVPKRGIVVYTHVGGRQIGFFDRSGRATGTLERVFYDAGEALRYPSFTRFLERKIELWQRKIRTGTRSG
jgi:hypothetical protein